ncbi:MAG: DUF2127 domain-containing protein [Calditrichaceae bacterium]
MLTNIKKNKAKILHNLFITGIIIKAIDGILELTGGIILISIKADTIVKIIHTIFKHEISEDPTDFMANYFIHLANNLSMNTIVFTAIYLILHGAVKIGLFLGLWYKKLWVYPLAGILLSIFIIYQLIRYFHTHSFILLLLIVVDIVIVILLRFEYNRIRRA